MKTLRNSEEKNRLSTQKEIVFELIRRFGLFSWSRRFVVRLDRKSGRRRKNAAVWRWALCAALFGGISLDATISPAQQTVNNSRFPYFNDSASAPAAGRSRRTVDSNAATRTTLPPGGIAVPSKLQGASAAPVAARRVSRISANSAKPASPPNAFRPADSVRLASAVVPSISTDGAGRPSAPNAGFGTAAVAPNSTPNGAPTSERLETPAEAMELAVAASRSQRALALRTGASRSTEDAARSLRNPKITNATAYVGMTNQPTARSEVDLSGLGSALPPSVAPMFAGLPSSIEALTPLCDKNFVASATAVTLPVYLGGRVQALTRSAEALTQAMSAGEKVGEQNVRLETSEAYFLVLRTRQLREVAAEATRTAAEHLADAERMFGVGMLTKNVVLAAQVALAEARQTELRVANAQSLSEAAYNRLLWRPLDSPVRIADVELGAPLGDLETLTAAAARNRAELRALAAQSRAMQEQENVARADVLPQVALVGAYTYFENSHTTENSNATGAVGMTWTPFDGGTSRARRDAARQDALALARARDEAESAIRLQVYQAFLAENEARERVGVAQTAVEQAEENYRVVTRGFQEGIVNHTEVLDALTLRTAAKSNFANARCDAVLATQRLRRAVGEL